ncbi:MAG: TonB-dependent receptor [Bacteroidota bacterium]
MRPVLLISLFLPYYCLAQFNLSGVVESPDGPTAYANVILSNPDGQFLQGTISDTTGGFAFTVATGTYQLTVTHLNYAKSIQVVTLSKDTILSAIFLGHQAAELSSVEVVATRPTIRRELDKTVVNIENSLLAQTGNVLESINVVPGLVLRNGQINMLGRSAVRIAIDGRLLELTGDALSGFLESLSASDIKEIEVISNPSARYAAAGNSGIVNFITRRLRQNAWSNQLAATYNQALYGWGTLNNNFNYRKNKVSLLVNGTYRGGNQYFLQIVGPKYSERPQRIESRQNRQLNSFSSRVQFDYRPATNTTLGLQYLGAFFHPRQTDDLHTTISDADNRPISFLQANDVRFDQDGANASYNVYVDQKLDTLGRRITLNLDLLDYRLNSENEVFSEIFDPNFNRIGTDFANLGVAANDIDNLSARLDVVHPFPTFHFEYGGQASSSKTDYALDNFALQTGSPISDGQRSGTFQFQEKIQAIYFNGRKSLGEYWQLQFGLRAEFTQTEGIATEAGEPLPVYRTNYGKLFPTLYLRYAKDDNQIFSLNFGRRINRPSYHQLNPARTFLSGQSSQRGNPFLLPSYAYNFELNHTFRSKLSTTLTFRRLQNAFSFLFDLDDATQQQTITYKNLFSENGASLMSSYNFEVTPWWHGRGLLFYNYSFSQKLDPAETIQLNNGSEWYASLNQQFHLNTDRTISAEVNFWYNSAYNTNIYRLGEAHQLDLTLQFRSLLPGMTLSIGGYDLFNASPRTASSTINGVEHDFVAFPSNRFFRLSLAYHFGNEEVNPRQRRFGNEEIRGRSN